jgi:hypothetical protein
MMYVNLFLILFLCLAPTGFGNEYTKTGPDKNTRECEAETVIIARSDGVNSVRMPDACFDSLPGSPHKPRYEEIAQRLVKFYAAPLGQSVRDAAKASSQLEGRWRAAETAEEKAQRLQAIDEVAKHLGRFKGGIARDRLSERTSPPQSLTIEIEASRVRIASGDRRIEVEVGGPPIEVSESEGKAQISAELRGSQLIVVARTGRGERKTAYSANGTRLLVKVVMTGSELAIPLKYVSTYARME